MFRFLTLISLLPIIAYLMARHTFYKKNITPFINTNCRITADEFAKKIKLTKKIPRKIKERSDAAALGEITLLAGFQSLEKNHAKPFALRMRANTLFSILPSLSILIAVFAILVGKRIDLCFFAVSFVNAIAAIMKFTTLGISKHAAILGIEMMKQARIPRQQDEAAIEICAKATAWK
jgi:hypothetical protein